VLMAQQNYRISNKKTVAETADLRVSEMTLSPGEEIPWHKHTRVTDTFYCLEGVVRLQTGRDLHGRLFRAGETCAMPPGEPHRVSNAGETLCRILLIQGIGAYDFVAVPNPHEQQVT
jgi:quercetin dioxygenase-like cupin family protein